MDMITALSHETRAAIGQNDVFDGVCVLCSGFFKFIIRTDTDSRFRFVTAQSVLGQSMYRDLGLPTDAFETNLVIVDGVIYQRLDAFAAAMRAIGWPWKALAVASWLPGSVKNLLYHAIARNRYKIFGRTSTCILPAPDVKSRFLDLPA
ncbi:Predicted thiol-disulfide oxidoreductase YuxK, DCC family [Jannaschia faecimaris]|uniref:Predicted thiol-disulfide oxidoreductase YuxK, DCC family n=1 Tax=Jannaschia faecimaris TaxID=1244108 RepID=A0A1H3L0X4_9RHOB|nr:DCC1-like thiol-disulfide oxidoreductase family protein [Jannaschia faecimaris]SDY57545.1 Predicted thiol-disulfide oxidoreductase YuxK, DCC family [Jannaschia faecimaris]